MKMDITIQQVQNSVMSVELKSQKKLQLLRQENAQNADLKTQKAQNSATNVEKNYNNKLLFN